MYSKQSKKRMGVWLLLASLFILTIASCHSEVATPRPDGYFRIEAYPKTYTAQQLGSITLLINDSAQCLWHHPESARDAQWLNIGYPRYNATIYLSYIPLQNNLKRLMGESLELVYRQNINTEQVEAVAYENPGIPLYATLFALSPESATPFQFIATDSTKYLLRGALYFDAQVKADSVAPALQHIEGDIMQLIESITPIAP